MKLNWRNPKIHSENRVKAWLACAEHSEYLRNYLEARNFFLGSEFLESQFLKSEFLKSKDVN